MTTQAIDSVLGISRLQKTYAGKTVLDAVSLQLAAGELLAVLGPNGAGKTTLINTVLGLTAADQGDIRLFGQLQHGVSRSNAVRQQLGVMMQIGSASANLTVREQCDLFSSYYQQGKSVSELLAIAGLENAADTRFGHLSGGQKQRLLFALALAGNPKLLFLDEPTLGMDVQARRALWQQIRQLQARGVSIVLTTHYLEEAEQLADRILLLQQGRCIAENSPAGLKEMIQGKHICCCSRLIDTELLALPGVMQLERQLQQITLLSNAPEQTVLALLQADPTLSALEVKPIALENIFLQLTNSAEVTV